MPKTHQQEPRSVKIKVDTRDFDVHLCGKKKNSVTVHIVTAGHQPECEPDYRWAPERRRK